MSTRNIQLFLGLIIFIVILGISYFSFLIKAKERSELTEFALSEGIMNRFKFEEIGLKRGDTIGDMALIDQRKSAQVSLRKLLMGAKSNVIITGSYTCDATRSQMHSIDSIFNIYNSHYDFFFIYTIEAHPQASQSPYSAEVIPWEAERNLQAGIQAAQPSTVGEREDLSDKLIEEETIKVPVLIDNAQNEFWKSIGQGPNMVVVVSPEGVILHKASWFDPQELGSFLGP